MASVPVRLSVYSSTSSTAKQDVIGCGPNYLPSVVRILSCLDTWDVLTRSIIKWAFSDCPARRIA